MRVWGGIVRGIGEGSCRGVLYVNEMEMRINVLMK